MRNHSAPVQGRDIPIVKLTPRRKRNIGSRENQRIAASVRSVGLIEPLVVFPEGDGYVILDGYQRFKILLELGVEMVPCLICKEK